MISWTLFPSKCSTLAPLSATLKVRFFPLNDWIKAERWLEETNPFARAKRHRFAIQPLLPFQTKNEWSTTAMIKEPCEAFAFENKSMSLDLGMNQRSRNMKYCFVWSLKLATKKKTPILLVNSDTWSILSGRTPPFSVALQIKSSPVQGLIRNRRRIFTRSLTHSHGNGKWIHVALTSVKFCS